MTTKTEIETRARKLVADHYKNTAGREPPEITDALPLIGGGSHLGADAEGDLDSLDHMEIVIALEEEFDIEIDDDTAEQLKTFGQAVEYLASKLVALAA
jgi:acyl carrier protein